MSETKDEAVIMTFQGERLNRLRKARELFESDTEKSISVDDFVDMLVKTFMLYRDKRGAAESSLLKKLTHENGARGSREL